MEVILIQDVDNLGAANEVVKVRNGYARNFLIPQKLAVEASPSNLKVVAEKRKVFDKKEKEMLKAVNEVIAKLKDGALKIGAKSGTSGKIFGSVTSLQLSRAIREQKGYEIDRKKIHVTDEVKELGTYKASIEFGGGNTTEIDGGFISAQFFYFVGDTDLLAIDLVSFLFADGAAQLQRGNATEDLATGTGFSSDLQGAFFQFGNYFIDGRQHLLFFLLNLFSFFL
jgi:large subunit ribosomal protein L9